ncbi:bacillithiol biosynthesis deacetylase BshB1 [candidate division KSB1 bacterium]|nr:bacillithiol biosynthesis deacetylase BshB1 [candidate division KSB1 bacterium]
MNEKVDILAVGAHPDDIELMCAGTLIKMVQQGFRVGMVSLTAGERGTRGTKEIRTREFENAARIIGANDHMIGGLADGRLENHEENRLEVIKIVRRFKPEFLFIPHWKARHPDHEACSHLVRNSAYYAGLKMIDTDQPPHRPKHIAYYMELYDFEPSFIVDISETFDQKLASIRAHESQFWNPDNPSGREEQTFISSPEFFESITIKARYWGQKIGVKYGEPFYMREPLGIADASVLLQQPSRL